MGRVDILPPRPRATGNDPAPFVQKSIFSPPRYDVRKILSAVDKDGDVAADMDLRDTQMLKQHIDELYHKTGAVHLVNTGLTSYAEFEAINNIRGAPVAYEGGANMRFPQEKVGGAKRTGGGCFFRHRCPPGGGPPVPRIFVKRPPQNVYDTGAPREADLQYHHEMAYLNDSPEQVSFFALEATKDPLKGATFISENLGATNMLMDHEFGQRLIDKGCCYVRKLPDQE